ncbi:hypothetical protein BDZ94DRAFT_1312187 [Collybia nuda]|uniref:Malate dehydrogenase n=1 Tax=Collybia nuda TaxID=64659 RepID=A0A9P5Y1T1_9AGAR|nr:hypothetical protein BDZ94DRAFT_1312187 [Collybia nuda]
MLFGTILSLAVTASAIALPKGLGSSCDVSHAQINLPTTPPMLVAPTGTPSFIVLSMGTENYTCTSAGTYMNIGAVAELFDISCLYKTPIQEAAYALWNAAPPSVTPLDLIASLHNSTSHAILGQHYVIRNPITGTGGVPKWDFTSQGVYKGNANAFVVANIDSAVPAPNPANAPYLRLTHLLGDLADQIYRVDTKGGQPPAGSCTPGSPVIAVRYTAKYWLFGGSIKK